MARSEPRAHAANVASARDAHACHEDAMVWQNQSRRTHGCGGDARTWRYAMALQNLPPPSEPLHRGVLAVVRAVLAVQYVGHMLACARAMDVGRESDSDDRVLISVLPSIALPACYSLVTSSLLRWSPDQGKVDRRRVRYVCPGLVGCVHGHG